MHELALAQDPVEAVGSRRGQPRARGPALCFTGVTTLTMAAWYALGASRST
jgi:hypothetical protein